MKSIIEPLLRDHAHIRTLAGELRAHTERFDLPGMRNTIQAMADLVEPHALKEESVLYLIGMKFLKANNKKLPELFKEHHQLGARLGMLGQLLYSARLTDVEDKARQLVFVILESLDHHLSDEEAVVFPALDKLIDEDHKELILHRYGVMDSDGFDELDRLPLVSLPPEHPMDNMGQTTFGQGTIG
jgi:iron-sulfur cluster repair protein YtfE (RIC family)